MSDLLDNELVRKYFADETEINEYYFAYLSREIIRAMQERIKKGERCLMIGQNGAVNETVWQGEPLMGIRFNAIRLPDRFQREVTWKAFEDLEKSLMNRVSEVSSYVARHIDCKHSIESDKPSEVEDKIKEIAEPIQDPDNPQLNPNVVSWDVPSLKFRLRTLVDLVRKEGK